MKKRFLALTLLIVAAIMSACTTGKDYKVGETYNGFKLEKKEFVKETNCDVLLFKHIKSGARLVKVAADDENKMFSITFRTVPENDWGTPHIMEHSVLNGSENFPVKSPFDLLIKGSLNTFLNAMTSSDFTTYPVASMNEKDYFNLMHVYLDAVLFPNLRTDDRIMKQEGWHYELNDAKEEITLKGVVYNEMKGAYSSPSRELGYQNDRVLFPDNTYGVESGGYPQAIPNLTQDYFVKFHEKYYHPSNSVIMLYGNADLDKELAFIDASYLSKFDDNGEKITIPLQKPFEAKKEIEVTYGVPEGSEVKDNTFLTYNVVTGLTSDHVLNYGLSIIAEAMVGLETAPLRVALQEAGIGKNVYAYCGGNLQNVFNITVLNANPEDKAKFNEIVEATFAKCAAEGFDAKAIEGIINSYEFQLREGNTPQKGLMCLFQLSNSMFEGDDVFAGLRYEDAIAKVKEGAKGTMFQDIIKNNLIGNPHTLLTVCKPEIGKEAKIAEQTRKQLAEYKKSLSKEQLDQLVADTKALIEYQKEEDNLDDVAKIPMLALSDIAPEVNYYYEVKEKSIAGAKTLHSPEFTNNIVYTNLYFNLYALPQDLIPYAKLLDYLIGSLSTENYTYGDLENEKNINTGGLYTYITSYTESNDDNKLQPKFVVTGKATIDKSDKLADLMLELISKTKYDDVDRLKELIQRHQASTESSVKNNGSNYAATRLSSYISNSGMFNEATRGVDYYNFITEVNSNFATNSQDVIAKLNQVAELLFTKDNMVIGITCSDDNYKVFEPAFTKLTNALPEGSNSLNAWKFDLQAKNEGLMSASKVQYVLKGYNFKQLGYSWDGKIQVLKQILSTNYLQNCIRVRGGAYGGYCVFSKNGNASFVSYRDPNLKETLENYDATPEFIKTFDVDSTEMLRYIIGTISNIEGPTTPSMRGSMAINNYFNKTTKAELEAERKAILTTTVEDIRSYEKMVSDILSKNVYCVYGSDMKIKENKDLFKNIYNVTK